MGITNMLNRTCLIVPCFNEQENIQHVIEETFSKVAGASIVVINDGSEDLTSEKAHQSGKAIVLDLPVNLGVGGAMQTGFKYALAANYIFAVKLDGDGQHPPNGIPALLQPLFEEKADIIIGSRFIENDTGFKSSPYRRAGIKILQWLCYLLTGHMISDPTSGFRAYNLRAIKFMAQHYPTFDYPEPEEIILAIKNDLRIIEVPVQMRERRFGQSTISSGVSVYYMLKVTLAMIFIFLRRSEKLLKKD